LKQETKIELVDEKKKLHVNQEQEQKEQGQVYQGPFAKELKEIRNMGFTSQSTEIIISLLSSAVKETKNKNKKNDNNAVVQWVVSKLIENSL